MKRDIARFRQGDFAALIIGGGIHGATIARELAAAGVRVALVEKGDFCSGASANSLKVIHGGIRYLQHLNLKRMRESIKSRRHLLREVPHLARPLPCLMPTYGHGLKGREVMRIALLLNDLISWDRNLGVEAAARIAHGGTFTRAECLRLLPGIREENLTGAALWHDVLAENTERIVLTFLHQAVARGATIANYCEVEDFVLQGRGIAAVRCRDKLSGEEVEITTSLVINAAGAWIDQITGKMQLAPTARGWAKAINIVVNKQFFGQFGVGLEGTREFFDKDAVVQKGKRLFFFVPWRGKTMIGTAYSPYRGQPDHFTVSSADLEDFLAEINEIYPAARLSRADITHYHGGLVPIVDLERESSGDVRLDKHSLVLDHAQLAGPNNLLTLKGVKYTTAIHLAGWVRDWVLKRLKELNPHFRPAPAQTGTPDDATSAQGQEGEIPEPVRARLVRTYGPRAAQVLQYAGVHREGLEVVSTEPLYTVAEILHGVREEMALHLADIIFRRSELATSHQPAAEVLRRIASIMATELNWDEQRLELEISRATAPFACLAVE